MMIVHALWMLLGTAIAAPPSAVVRPFYFIHIPKTGGTTFLKSLGMNGGLSWSSRTHGHSDNGNSSKNGGVGGGDVYQVLSDELRISQWRQIAAAKGGGRPLAVLLRNPFTHVPSQYHHCLSSPAHKERGKLPKTLYAWLDYHARASLNHDVQAQQAISTFHCYNPVNLQRERAGYNLTDYAFVGITEEM
eukprot:gene15186-25283_t